MMSRFKTLGLVILALALSGSAHTQSPPTATRRVPQFENESVRVWKSIIALGSR